MKKMAPIIIFWCILFSNIGYSQINREDYFGTWRWVSNRSDTVIIHLKSVGKYITAYKDSLMHRSGVSDIVGFHYFAENNKMIESSLQFATEDTISNHSTIGGLYLQKEKYIRIGVYHIERHWMRSGLFIILPNVLNGKTMALLTLSNQTEWEAELGVKTDKRAFPNNIVLEKIKNYEGVPD